MIRTKLAKKILTKKEQKHLTASGINSMAAMKRQAAFIRKELEERQVGHPSFPCWECGHIAFKLGI